MMSELSNVQNQTSLMVTVNITNGAKEDLSLDKIDNLARGSISVQLSSADVSRHLFFPEGIDLSTNRILTTNPS